MGCIPLLRVVFISGDNRVENPHNNSMDKQGMIFMPKLECGFYVVVNLFHRQNKTGITCVS